MIKISEEQLKSYALCPLRGRPSRPSDLERAAEETINWFLAQLFKGSYPLIVEVHAQFENYLRTSCKWTLAKVRKSAVASCRSLAKRLSDFSNNLGVVQPVAPYSLLIGGETICGEYAVVERKPPNSRQAILRVWSPDERHRNNPDIVSMARWYHFITQEEHPVSIYHMGVLDGSRFFQHGMEQEPVRRYLGDIIECMKAKRQWAAPGAHCESCVTRTCREVLTHAR